VDYDLVAILAYGIRSHLPGKMGHYLMGKEELFDFYKKSPWYKY